VLGGLCCSPGLGHTRPPKPPVLLPAIGMNPPPSGRSGRGGRPKDLQPRRVAGCPATQQIRAGRTQVRPAARRRPSPASPTQARRTAHCNSGEKSAAAASKPHAGGEHRRLLEMPNRGTREARFQHHIRVPANAFDSQASIRYCRARVDAKTDLRSHSPVRQMEAPAQPRARRPYSHHETPTRWRTCSRQPESQRIPGRDRANSRRISTLSKQVERSYSSLHAILDDNLGRIGVRSTIESRSPRRLYARPIRDDHGRHLFYVVILAWTLTMRSPACSDGASVRRRAGRFVGPGPSPSENSTAPSKTSAR